MGKTFKNIAFILISVMILFSCKGKESHTLDSKGELWSCTEFLDNPLILSTLAESYRLLPLETNDASLLGGINKIVYQDSLIFLLDKRFTSKVFAFTANDGKFVRKLGKIGNGPGEYSNIDDISIDKENRQIHILADRNRLITYTLDGDYVTTKQLPFMATHMEYMNNRLFFVCDLTDMDNLLITDMDFNILSSHFPNEVYKSNYRILLHPLQKKENELLFHRFLDNRIYRINLDGELSVAYQIDFGANSMSLEDIDNLTEKELKEIMKTKVGNVKYFTETDKYAFIMFFNKNSPCVSIFDKKANQAKSYTFQSLRDDFIGKDFPILEYTLPDGVFTSVIPFKLIEHLVENKLIQNVNEDSNPILYQLY